MSNGNSVSISVSGSGISVSSSSGSRTLDTGEISGGDKNIEMNAKEYVYITCEDSRVLLLPDAIHMKAEEIYI